MTAQPVYPAWLSHDGTCTHQSGDPEHLNLIQVRFGGRDTIELVTALVPPGDEGGGGTVVPWLLPLVMLWHRRTRRQKRTAAAALLGVPLEPLNLLVVTDQRLRFWELTSKGRGGRRRLTVGRQLGDVDRMLVRSITNRSVGDGWRTCALVLTDGTTMAVRVSARSVPGLVAAFPGPAD